MMVIILQLLLLKISLITLKKDAGGYWIEIDRYIVWRTIIFQSKLLDKKDMHGKWNDILVNTKWTSQKMMVFFKIWINGKVEISLERVRTQHRRRADRISCWRI